MNTAIATRNDNLPSADEVMENVIIKGDLSRLTPAERSEYYLKVCQSVGLNPLTKPFEYITLNGKLTLYALRACTDQLRTIHKVSVEELTETERDGVFIVTAKVRNGEGRTDMAKGAVTIASLKGDALANAMMKAETKAKRRATLSICGLGFLDETEIETIPGARSVPKSKPIAIKEVPRVVPAHDAETGEIIEPHQIDVPQNGDGRNWIEFGKLMIAAVQANPDNNWIELNRNTIADMREEAPKVYDRMMAAINTVTDAA